MAHVTIADDTPEESFAVGGSAQSVFSAINWPIFSLSEDLEVYVGGSLAAYNASPSTSLQYSVSGSAVDGGFESIEVTLGAAVTNTTVVVRRKMPIKRTTDLPYPSSTLDIKQLNTELDRFFAAQQQINTEVSKALRLGPTEVGSLAAVPAAALRANRLLGFDANGDPEVVSAISDPGAASVADAQSATATDIYMSPARTNDYLVYGRTVQDPDGASALTHSGEAYYFSFGNGALTGNDIYNPIFPDVEHYDVAQHVLDLRAGSTIEHATAVAGYVSNASDNSGGTGTNGVALFGAATATVDGAHVWGINTLLMDNATRAVHAGSNRKLIGAELDFNVMGAGTEIIGISIGGNSLAQPTTSNGFIVNSLGGGFKWGSGFITIDGATDVGLQLGLSAASGNDVASAKVNLSSTDSGGIARTAVIQHVTGNYLTIAHSAAWNGVSIISGNLYLSSGRDVVIDGAALSTLYQPLDGDLTAIAALAKTDGNFIVGNGSAWIVESGASARTSMGAAGLADTNSFTAKQSISVTGTEALSLTSTNAGAGEGPILDLFRDSGSVAQYDEGGSLRFLGKNAASETIEYGGLSVLWLDITDGNEGNLFSLFSMSAGGYAERLRVSDGIWHPSATGGSQGNNTINMGGVYDDGSLLTCVPFDRFDPITGKVRVLSKSETASRLAHWDGMVDDIEDPGEARLVQERDAQGRLQFYKNGRRKMRKVVTKRARKVRRTHEGAHRFLARQGTEYDPLDIKRLARHIADKGHHPTFPNPDKWHQNSLSIGGWQSRLQEGVEINAIHIIRQDLRLDEHEARLIKLEKSA